MAWHIAVSNHEFQQEDTGLGVNDLAKLLQYLKKRLLRPGFLNKDDFIIAMNSDMCLKSG